MLITGNVMDVSGAVVSWLGVVFPQRASAWEGGLRLHSSAKITIK
jgi:hypothetical protein